MEIHSKSFNLFFCALSSHREALMLQFMFQKYLDGKQFEPEMEFGTRNKVWFKSSLFVLACQEAWINENWHKISLFLVLSFIESAANCWALLGAFVRVLILDFFHVIVVSFSLFDAKEFSSLSWSLLGIISLQWVVGGNEREVEVSPSLQRRMKIFRLIFRLNDYQN